MANHDDKNDNHEELSPLLGKQVGEEDAKKAGKATDAKADTATVTVDKAPASAPGNRRYGWTANGLPLGHGSVVGEPMGEEDAKKAGKATDAKADTATVTVDKAPTPAPGNFGGYGWTADRLPLGHGSVVGEPMGRAHWDSSLFDCLGRSEGFCNSDLEVCLLGSVAPCVLYGNNAKRVASSPGSFACHCLSYTGLLLLGISVFGWNCLAPWLSFASRTTIRRKFNLEGSWEALHRSCGCCGCFLEDEAQREQCETACDFATHLCCHRCALCQEGRELRLRLPHPGFNAQPILVMIPPVEQSMGRGVGELPALV